VTGPIRVLHAHSGNLYGGIEAMLLTLVRTGYPGLQHSFALCYEGRFEQEARQLDAAVELLGPARFSRPLSILRARRRFAQALEESQPDVVMCHSSWSHAIFAPPVRAAGIPSAFWLHAPPSGPATASIRAWPAPPCSPTRPPWWCIRRCHCPRPPPMPKPASTCVPR
jgi:hypothetical protein